MEANAVVEAMNILKIRSVLGSEFPELDILRAFSQSGNNPDAAIKYLIDNLGLLSRPLTIKRTVTSTGARISAQIKDEASEESDGGESMYGLKTKVGVKEESDVGVEKEGFVKGRVECVQQPPAKKGRWELFDEFLQSTNTKVVADDEYLNSQIKQEAPKQSI